MEMKTVEEELSDIFGPPNCDEYLAQWGSKERSIWFNKINENEWRCYNYRMARSPVLMGTDELTIFISDSGDDLRKFLADESHSLPEYGQVPIKPDSAYVTEMPFTQIASCGIPEEPSRGYTYNWKQTLREATQGCTIDLNLVIDPTFISYEASAPSFKIPSRIGDKHLTDCPSIWNM